MTHCGMSIGLCWIKACDSRTETTIRINVCSYSGFVNTKCMIDNNYN